MNNDRLWLARVSTGYQTLAAQDAQLHAAGVAIYSEKVSGAVTDRPELAKLLKRLDVVAILRMALDVHFDGCSRRLGIFRHGLALTVVVVDGRSTKLASWLSSHRPMQG